MEDFKPKPQHALAFAVGAVFVVVYPILAVAALDEWSPRVLALVWLGLAVVSVLVRRKVEERSWTSLMLNTAPGFVLLAWAVVSDAAMPLRLLPAAVNVILAVVFLQTLRDEHSIIEVGARLIEPRLPDFTRSYCRRSTALWAVFFLASAAVAAWLAIAGSSEAWAAFTTRTYFVAMAVLGVGEFLVRKIHFRHYEDNAIDRAFASVFPAHATAVGRRSAAYIAEQRAADLAGD